jgi:hypothetical protein
MNLLESGSRPPGPSSESLFPASTSGICSGSGACACLSARCLPPMSATCLPPNLNILAQAQAGAQTSGSREQACLVCQAPDVRFRACRKCGKPILHVSVSITDSLLDTARPFFGPDAAWQELHSLGCQSVKVYDKRLFK